MKTRLITLKPASRAAVRIMTTDTIETVPHESGNGPACPVCGGIMKPIKGHDPHFVKCVGSECLYAEVPFHSSEPADDMEPVKLSPEEMEL